MRRSCAPAWLFTRCTMSVEPIQVHESECDFSAIRAAGAGGQNVNKVSNAVHLRYDVRASSLPEDVKVRVLALADQRITADGVVIIKAQAYRSLEKNRSEALLRLQQMVASVATAPRERRPTKASRSARRKRVDTKVKRGLTKALRGKVLA